MNLEQKVINFFELPSNVKGNSEAHSLQVLWVGSQWSSFDAQLL